MIPRGSRHHFKSSFFSKSVIMGHYKEFCSSEDQESDLIALNPYVSLYTSQSGGKCVALKFQINMIHTQ